MTNRIDTLFKTQKNNILSVFITAGYPNINDTLPLLIELQKNKVDMIEVGIPFSDPLADGNVVQESSQQALKNGMTLQLLLTQLRDLRKHIHIPILLMGYYNSMLQFGEEALLKKCAEVGIDGLIIPDLPMEDYVERLKNTYIKYHIHNIFLISPQTPIEKIKKIDALKTGFIYCVSSSSTTGAKDDFSAEQRKYFKKINALKLNTPLMVGFGISNFQTFKTACQYFNGAIIGSAFIKKIQAIKKIKSSIVEQFVKDIKG